jgi:hypothetical protein
MRGGIRLREKEMLDSITVTSIAFDGCSLRAYNTGCLRFVAARERARSRCIMEEREDLVTGLDNCIPELRLDNREIIAVHLASPDELDGIALTGAVAAYLRGNLC